jgi:hypothetical protein
MRNEAFHLVAPLASACYPGGALKVRLIDNMHAPLLAEVEIG